MLTSCKLTGNPASISAYHTKEENYYFSQGSDVENLSEPNQARSHVRVHGKLAAQLGLTPGGEISQAAFTNLLSGKDAAGNKVSREHKVMGIDLVFSAPKSVSVAGLVTERDSRIIEAHDQAVLETMREIEVRHAAAQPRPGECVKTGNMAYVTARDGYNRDHDPHLHTHVVVMNLTSMDGKVLALDGRQIMAQDFNKMWGAMYRAKLAAKLKELGYSVSYTKKGELRLDAVSLAVEREFSRRHAKIASAKANGARDMDAWRKTRKDKDPDVEKSAVRSDWESRIARHREKTAEENRQDAVRAREEWFKEAKWSVEARQELAGERQQTEIARWQAAARRATEGTACASKEAMITEYLAELGRAETWEPVTFAQANHLLWDQVRAGNLLVTDDGRYTTWEMTRVERECLQARKAAGALAMEGGAAEARVAELANGIGRRLSEAQAKAAAAILTAERGTVLVQGDAGSGKTTMLKAVNRAAQEARWEVVGVTVQGVAARKLEDESGIMSETLASYLAQERREAREAHRKPRGPRLVVVDEASMLDSRGLAELLRNAAEHDDKVVLVGDRNQIQAVGAGRPFERLVEAAEKSGELVSLTENYRQRDSQLRKAVDLAREGRMRESLAVLDQAGKVAEISDARLRRLFIAQHYDKDVLILTGSRQGREELNVIIREELARQGKIGAAREYTLSWSDHDGVKQSAKRELAVGERVVFLENEYGAYDVRNGEIGYVTRTGKDSISVRLEEGREVCIDLARYSALDHGYALTTYKSQGQTYDKVVVEADTSVPQLQDQRNTYVQITRARDDVRIFTDDAAELRGIAAVSSVKQDTHDINVTLDCAERMERKVRLHALGELAHGKGLADDPCIYNRAYMAGAGDSELLQRGRLEHMADMEKRLNERKDLNDAERHRAAEYLSSEPGAKALSTYKALPDYSIAIGLIRSGTMDFETATNGMKIYDKHEIQRFLEIDKGREERARIQERVVMRHSMDPAVKERIVKFFDSPEAKAVLAWKGKSAEAKLAVAEIVTKTQTPEDACRHLKDDEKGAVALKAQAVLAEREQSRDRGRSRGRGLEFGRGLGL
ncbi:MAG: relaxase domain-containing protein [Elusimicrobia bacterium]|nr:relaxase domain-containing protein [Elusimicrobiota bacterium]